MLEVILVSSGNGNESDNSGISNNISGNPLEPEFQGVPGSEAAGTPCQELGLVGFGRRPTLLHEGRISPRARWVDDETRGMWTFL